MPGDTRSLELEAKTASLQQAMEFVQQGGLEAGLPAANLGELDLIVEELFMNVCRHAYPEHEPGVVTIAYRVCAPAQLSVEVADRGSEFNPLTAEDPNVTSELKDRPVGGLGIFLVKSLASSLQYRREDDWNRLTFQISGSQSERQCG